MLFKDDQLPSCRILAFVTLIFATCTKQNAILPLLPPLGFGLGLGMQREPQACLKSDDRPEETKTGPESQIPTISRHYK